METGVLKANGTEIKYSILKDSNNSWRHFFYSIVPDKSEQIVDQIKTIEEAEAGLFKALNIEKDTATAKRFFSSDLINHCAAIMDYKKRQSTDFTLSLTEQPPVPSIKAALLGMCQNNIVENGKYRDGNTFYFDTESGLRHIFAEHLIDSAADEHSDSDKQTEVIFKSLEEILSTFDTSIEDSLLRTWIYAPHVDADYAGIVNARNKLFDSINLTKDTHYIASTGIQGGTGNQYARVFMDAYAVKGVDKSKIRYIQAPEHLCPTHVYGVAFERATAIEMGEVDYLFISGTASIDNEGEVVHPGDIAKQAERTLENISALLSAADFTKEDLSSFMIYLRDPADYSFVKPILDQYAKNLPAVYLKASVCRPGWLIEIEGAAAKLVN